MKPKTETEYHIDSQNYEKQIEDLKSIRKNFVSDDDLAHIDSSQNKISQR